jgi:hypothetical protein
MNELYPQLELRVPEKDDPIPKPRLEQNGDSSYVDEQGRRHVRWGDGLTWHWDWGERFKTPEDVFAFSPLEQEDFSNVPDVEPIDYRDEETIYQTYRVNYPAEWGDRVPQGSTVTAGFYNTLFMWPLLTFGWNLFLRTCLDDRFKPVMDEFAEISRRVFRVFARLPVNFVLCHDDIVNARGPICSPAWMHRYIFPRYKEFWGTLKAAGKEVIFISDGRLNAYADDIMACGARGIITEPYTDFRAIARKHKDCFLAGEGDCRVLLRNDPAEIEAMVQQMAETASMTGGYAFCVGNHVPWNTPPHAAKLYLDLCAKMGHR